jgi:ribosomal protein S27AE
MSILKYYKVDSDGKIKRLRRECPASECGAGVFVSFDICPILYILFLNILYIDGVPQGPPILWSLRFDVHLPAWHQTPCSLI